MSSVEWEVARTPALLDGLAPIQVLASPTIPSWNQINAFLKDLSGLREKLKDRLNG